MNRLRQPRQNPAPRMTKSLTVPLPRLYIPTSPAIVFVMNFRAGGMCCIVRK